MRAGETWYVLRPGATCLVKVVIEDITDKTICVKEYSGFLTCGNALIQDYARPERYKYGYLEFVEQVKEVKE